jgi:hypothetical protein
MFMEIGMVIMAPEPISTAYFINLCHQFVCLYVYSLSLQLAGETEILRENLPQCHFVHHKSHLAWARTRAATVGSRQLTA